MKLFHIWRAVALFLVAAIAIPGSAFAAGGPGVMTSRTVSGYMNNVVLTYRPAGAAEPIRFILTPGDVPFVYQKVRNIPYPAQISMAGNHQPKVTLGAIEVGYTLTVLAYVEKNGGVGVKYTFTAAKLIRMVRSTYDGLTIKMPDTRVVKVNGGFQVSPGPAHALKLLPVASKLHTFGQLTARLTQG